MGLRGHRAPSWGGRCSRNGRQSHGLLRSGRRLPGIWCFLSS